MEFSHRLRQVLTFLRFILRAGFCGSFCGHRVGCRMFAFRVGWIEAVGAGPGTIPPRRASLSRITGRPARKARPAACHPGVIWWHDAAPDGLDRHRRDPWLVRSLVAVHHGFDEGHALQPVMGQRHVLPQHARFAPLLPGADRLGETGVKVGEGFQIALGVAGGRAGTGLGVVRQIVGAALDGLHAAIQRRPDQLVRLFLEPLQRTFSPNTRSRTPLELPMATCEDHNSPRAPP